MLLVSELERITNADRRQESRGVPNHNAVAVANEFLKRRDSAEWPRQMLLHTLSHIADGWNLIINGYPLIAEAAEAWDNGPVYRSLWDHIRDHGYRGPARTLTVPDTGEVVTAALTSSEREIIDHVWRKYGPMGAARLSRTTHELGTPWGRAYFERGRNAPLDNDDIRSHYTELALTGRRAAG